MKHPNKHNCGCSSEEEKNRVVKGDLRVKGDLKVEGKLKVCENATFNENVTVKGTLNAQNIVAQTETVKNLTVDTINANKVGANEVCLKDRVSPPAPETNAGCLYTIAGTPDSLQFIDNQGTTYTVDLTPTNPFHGWWQRFGRPSEFSFDADYDINTSDTDPYIFIDVTTKPYVTLTPLFGTLKYPREPTSVDQFPPHARSFTFAAPNALVNTAPTFGVIPSTFSLTLQPDGVTLFACADSLYNYDSQTGFSLYRKIKKVPVPVMSDGPTSTAVVADPNNPVFLAEYIFNALQIVYNQESNVNLNDPDYVGIPQAEAIFSQFLTTGFAQTTPIRQIRVSINPAPTPELATDIFTGDPVTNIGQFSYATPGATIVLAGFVDQGLVQWSKLNGTYLNGVSYVESGAVPNPSATHLDSGPNGTFYNVFDHFLLRGVNQQTGFNCDTSGLPTKPQQGPPNIVPAGYANYPFDGTQTVTVFHKFTSDMEYPAFIAALFAMFYAIYRVSQHNGFGAYTVPESIHIFDTWSQLATALKIPGATQLVDIRTRVEQASPTDFYQNINFRVSAIPPATYNDPYGISTNMQNFNYNTVLGNYVVNPFALFWGIQGTLQPDQTDPAIIGYPALIPGPGRAGFIGQLVPITVVNGIPNVTNPDPVHFMSAGDQGSDQANANGYYIGLINPTLLGLGSKKIGYMFLIDMLWIDPLGLAGYASYSPEPSSSPRFGRGGVSSMYANVMKFFATDQNVDSLILDIRGNNGGLAAQIQAIREFMGDVQTGMTEPITQTGVGYSSLVDPTTFVAINNVQVMNANGNGQVYVNLNQTLYPQSVFQGTALRPRKVIILTNWRSNSAGDFAIGQLRGQNLDGNLGAFVTSQILLDVDGRLKGSAFTFNPVPISETDARLVDSDGNPVSPISYRPSLPYVVELMGNPKLFAGVQNNYSAVAKAPTWVGKSGGNPLPNDWENTVWNSIGFIAPPALPPLPGWTAPAPNPTIPTTWRDFTLEQAILAANS